MQITRLRTPGLLAIVQLAAASSFADIDLRVEAWPKTEPVDVSVRVSDGGDAIDGLTAGDFAVTLDGQALDDYTLALPPSQDPTQRISDVLVVSDPTGVEDFLRHLAVGDHASIVTFRDDREARYAPVDVQP